MSLGLASYGARHVQALLASLGRLARNPLGTLLTLIVIALALALPLGLELLVTNARIATGDQRPRAPRSCAHRSDFRRRGTRRVSRLFGLWCSAQCAERKSAAKRTARAPAARRRVGRRARVSATLLRGVAGS